MMSKTTGAFLALAALAALWARPIFACSSATPQPMPSAPGRCQPASAQSASQALQSCLSQGEGGASRAQGLEGLGSSQEGAAITDAQTAGAKVAGNSSHGATGAYEGQGKSAIDAAGSLSACASEATQAAQAFRTAESIEQAFQQVCPGDCSGCTGQAGQRAAEMEQLAQNCSSRASEMNRAAGDAARNAGATEQTQGQTPPPSPQQGQQGGQEQAKTDDEKKEESGGVTEPGMEDEETKIDSDGREKTESEIIEDQWARRAEKGDFTKSQEKFVKDLGPEAQALAEKIGAPKEALLSLMARDLKWKAPADVDAYMKRLETTLSVDKFKAARGQADATGWARKLGEAGYMDLSADQVDIFVDSVDRIERKFP